MQGSVIDYGAKAVRAAGDSRITGVVLAGGKSTRLGRNKSCVRFARKDGELDLLANTVAILENVCGKAIIVGQQMPGYTSYPDITPGKGPMGGIETALKVTHTACLVLSCDLPFMNQRVLERLLMTHRNRPAGKLSTAYKSGETGRIEALVAIYEQETLPMFSNCLANNLLKSSITVPMERQYFIPYSEEESRYFFNINHPADLETAARIISVMGE